jgi:uncharacterized membrane protein
MRKIQIIVLGIILFSFVTSVYFYDKMPEKMASHWNAQGEVDGYMPKSWALFLMPLISAGLFLLFVAVPKIDPMKENIKKFIKFYDVFILLFIGFLFYIQSLTILWGAGTRFDIIQALSPAFALLFYYCGILTENAKQNWFIGIRTPWTMSSEIVWNKTHRLGGKLFKISGIIAVFGVLLPDYAIFLVLVPVILFAAYTVIYSYLEYQREQK